MTATFWIDTVRRKIVIPKFKVGQVSYLFFLLLVFGVIDGEDLLMIMGE